MLTIQQLDKLESLPNMSDISLQLLLEFYETYLCSRDFNYNLVDGSGNELNVNLSFYNKHFCHLLGIQHIKARGSTIVKGESGFQNIKDGLVTFDTLKSINKANFKSTKYRIRYFPFLLKLLENPSVIQFDTSLVSDCIITCDFMLHDDYESRKIHLGIEKSIDDYYYAKTFMVENNCGTRYTANQQSLLLQGSQIITK